MQAEPLKVDRSESGARERGGLTGRHGTALRPRDMLLAVLLLGSVWGMVEVVLGGALHLADAPHRVAIVTGLGMGIMGVGLGAFRRVYMLPLIALVVVAVRQLAVPILHVPFVCHANSCLAILIEGCALAGVVAAAGSRLTGQPPSPGVPAAVPRARWISAAVVGGCAALLASGVFH
ncbi:MAG: hypothetical protein JW952_04235, partial [Candidatus Eisenbacteria bacterium]|nr:hypothetical protein [Candidatus Eisenbacteria bacterium]